MVPLLAQPALSFFMSNLSDGNELEGTLIAIVNPIWVGPERQGLPSTSSVFINIEGVLQRSGGEWKEGGAV